MFNLKSVFANMVHAMDQFFGIADSDNGLMNMGWGKDETPTVPASAPKDAQMGEGMTPQ